MDAANSPVDNPVNLPIRWTAPEFFLESSCSSASDVWSFGVVLFEILTKGSAPYKEMDDPQSGFNNKTLMAMLESGWRMPRHAKVLAQSWIASPHCSPAPPHDQVPTYFYGIMLDCWQADRRQRPSFRYISEVLQRLCDADKLKEVSGNWGEGLVDSSGRPLPDYRSVGPRYKPKSWAAAKADAAALLLEWTKERESTMKRRDREMLTSLQGAHPGEGIAANA